MGKKKLPPTQEGRIAGRLASIILENDGFSFNDAFDYYMENDLTPLMKQYNIQAKKASIIKRAEKKIQSLSNKITTEVEVSPEGKATTKGKGKGKKRKMGKILSVRLKKGGVDIIEDDEGNMMVKKQKNNTKAGLFCEDGSEAEVIDEDEGTAGCFFP